MIKRHDVERRRVERRSTDLILPVNSEKNFQGLIFKFFWIFIILICIFIILVLEVYLQNFVMLV